MQRIRSLVSLSLLFVAGASVPAQARPYTAPQAATLTVELSSAARADVVVIANARGADPELFARGVEARTDAGGKARLELAPGVWRVSTLVGADGAVALSELQFIKQGGSASLALAPTAGDLPFAGTVEGAQGEARVHCERREDGALVHARCDAQGAFRLVLPRGTWRAFASAGGLRSEWMDRRNPEGNKLVLAPVLDPLRAPSAEQQASLNKSLRSWKASLPGADELAELAERVGEARVVGVGDALRGTRQEFELTAALFKRLVEQHGFQLLAIDAPVAELWRLDGYLLSGAGDPAALLRDNSWGDLARAEFLELLRWMRAWNADEKHERKLRLAGLDVLHTRVAAAIMQEFYPKVDPLTGERFAAWMALYRQVDARGVPQYGRLDEQGRMSSRLMMADLTGIWPDERENYTKFVSEAEYESTGVVLRSLGHCEEVLRMQSEGWPMRMREQHMHTTLEAALERCGADAKALVWARDSIAGVAGEADLGSLGAWLRAAHGARYVSIGLQLGRGQALLEDGRQAGDAPGPLAVVELAAPVAGSLEAVLGAGGAAGGVLDLRKLDAEDPARAWLASERLRRELAGPWLGEQSLYRRWTPATGNDLLVWLRDVTPATVLKSD